MSAQVQRVALTGGIATGKSYVTARLAAAGVPVVDADVLSHRAVVRGAPALEAIQRRFGASVITSTGDLDRPRVASIVFQDPAARRDLEAIIHPVVRQGIEDFFANVAPPATFGVADIPLLFETGRRGEFAATIVVACRRDTQVDRVMSRNGLTRAEAERRVDAQSPIDAKVAQADYVIRTDGSFADTNRDVDDLIAALGHRFPARS